MSYDPTNWQALHPLGSRATYAGLSGTRIVVQVGKAGKTGVRVKFPAWSRYAGWHTVHPDDLRHRP